MNKYSVVLICVASLFLFSCSEKKEDKTGIEEKIDSILQNMTVEEKIGQTCQVTLDALLKKDENGLLVSPIKFDDEKLNEALTQYHIGSVLNVGWCTLSKEEWAYVTTTLHEAYAKSTIKTPIIYGIDAIHGINYTKGATLFPQEIGLAATWNKEIAEEFAEITAYETRASGIPWNFSPVLDIARQPLWSRNFETLGEDPYLASELGAAIIKGYQGNSEMIDEYHVAACMKHFVGYSGSQSGRDRTPAWIPEKHMQELYLPSFKKAVEQGALTVMINSGTVNGVPGHANKRLITDILKNEWGFKGFAVSDWEDFIMLNTVHRTDSTLKDAYISAFNAGVDMSMVPLAPQYKEYCEIMIAAVNEGRITNERLDDAVRRILRVKMLTKLFDEQPDLNNYDKFGSQEFKTASLNAALESITLLKNDALLPLKGTEKVLVAGPTSNNLIYLNGAWTHTWQGQDTSFNTAGCSTIKQAFEKKIGSQTFFSQGAELYADNFIEKTRFLDVQDYSKKLDQVDVVVLCLGEMPSTEKPGDITSLNLNAEQLELAKIAYKKNKKVILVLLEGRPRIIRDIVDQASAIVQCYLPGDYGADALVQLLYGEANFSGRLPYTYPRFDGVIEFYDHERSVARDNNGGFNAFNPQWEFGYGLSYAPVSYSNLQLNTKTLRGDNILNVSIEVHNPNSITTKEVVQLYLSQHFASTAPANKKLKRFEKIELQPNETKVVTFNLTSTDLEFIDNKGEVKKENGTFTIKLSDLVSTFDYTSGE
jgi:beta-glucosidase